jgi:hypothetical protein
MIDRESICSLYLLFFMIKYKTALQPGGSIKNAIDNAVAGLGGGGGSGGTGGTGGGTGGSGGSGGGGGSTGYQWWPRAATFGSWLTSQVATSPFDVSLSWATTSSTEVVMIQTLVSGNPVTIASTALNISSQSIIVQSIGGLTQYRIYMASGNYSLMYAPVLSEWGLKY